MKNLRSIVSNFRIEGTLQEIKPLGAGLINDTYKVTTQEAEKPDYVPQRCCRQKCPIEWCDSHLPLCRCIAHV